MKKITLNLILVLVVVSIGCLGADQAQASAQDVPVPVIVPDDLPDVDWDLIYLQNEGGNDGDPDSAGDGLGFMGDNLFDFLGGNGEIDGYTWEELMRYWFENLMPQP